MNRIPSKYEILAWIADNPAETSKRDIAKAFGIKGAERIDLKRVLKELEADGHLEKRRRTYRDPDRLPPVTMLRCSAPTATATCSPSRWNGTGEGAGAARPDRPAAKATPRLAEGDRILARVTEVEAEAIDYEARLIRRIGTNRPPHPRHLPQGGRGRPHRAHRQGGRPGMARRPRCHAGRQGRRTGRGGAGRAEGPHGPAPARIIDRLGDPSAPKAVSLIAIHQHGIPDDFPDEAIAEADAMKPAGPEGREDLRDLPFVTIDPPTPATTTTPVCAHADDDPKNEGGHVVWVAIADVAALRPPGPRARPRGAASAATPPISRTASCRCCPTACRATSAPCTKASRAPASPLRMKIDAGGHKIAHRFVRGLMRSAASLNYEEVQEAEDGAPNDRCAPLVDEVIAPALRRLRAPRRRHAPSASRSTSTCPSGRSSCPRKGRSCPSASATGSTRTG